MPSLSFLFQTDLLSRNDPLTLSPSTDLLSVRKPSVGRTHSLPNDSYMFQTPETGPYAAASGEKTSAHQKSQSGMESLSQKMLYMPRYIGAVRPLVFVDVIVLFF